MAKKILVIDDEEILTKTFARLLARQGYEVKIASRGEDAVAMVKSEDFDLLLCDIRMPGQNGVVTTRQIQEYRTGSGGKAIPVIFLTGYADEKLEAEAQALQPVAYIYKPFDVSRLLEKVKEAAPL